MAIYDTRNCLQSLMESGNNKYNSFVSNTKEYKPIKLKGFLYHTVNANIVFVYRKGSNSNEITNMQKSSIEWVKSNWNNICSNVNEKLEKFAGTDNPIKLRYRFRNPSLYVFNDGPIGIMMYDHDKSGSGTIILLKPSIKVVDSKEYLN